MGVRFLKMAVVYILVGISIGIYMGISLNFALTSVHAHTNLFGWATLALCGFTYLRFPKAAESPLAKWHFWLQGIGLPIMLITLTLMAHGYAPNWVTMLKRIGESVAGTGILIFAINVFTNVNAKDIPTKHQHDVSM
ncbi:cbb3-type cytochrome oxidase subunit 1 [Paenibacillus sp. V4I3]|uniref:hypothetical protein n=1 Tax=unclassified Paenibacillus TaxID=185978 RepID=UPI00278452C2|nr:MULTISPECIES: hypothetical protein [unclassified Paenibacillus]MDQ0877619.1 cbb3-type cytochrome oxidase subunit 1 [Paenibacillus sp. V4I3]MDQ0886508.1 cbb3-type cytochrome oxidase subunit 1 [Paenibacillus sp. V4I9]